MCIQSLNTTSSTPTKVGHPVFIPIKPITSLNFSFYQMLLLRWHNTHREYGGYWPPLLYNSITKKHGDDVLMVIKEPVTVNVGQVPNLTQLFLLQPSLRQYVARNTRRKKTTLRSEGLELLV